MLVLGLKSAAWYLTGSVALLSDALESTVNIVTAGATLVALRVAHRPADTRHHFGYHKAEFLSAVVEGVMIVLAAVFIVVQASQALRSPQALDAPLAGLLMNAAATVLNGAWCYVLLTQGRARRSPALVADGIHLRTDVISSLGVLVGVFLAVTLGWPILDPLLAVGIAASILYSGYQLLRTSVLGLMDLSLPAEDLARLDAALSSATPRYAGIHALRTRHDGRAVFVDFHLNVPRTMTVSAAHEICDRLEAAIEHEFPDARVTIHVEPIAPVPSASTLSR